MARSLTLSDSVIRALARSPVNRNKSGLLDAVFKAENTVECGFCGGGKKLQKVLAGFKQAIADADDRTITAFKQLVNASELTVFVRRGRGVMPVKR